MLQIISNSLYISRITSFLWLRKQRGQEVKDKTENKENKNITDLKFFIIKN